MHLLLLHLGAQIEQPARYGPYCFRIHGQIYHRSGTLHPPDGKQPTYGQVYILEGEQALQTWMSRNVDTAPDIMLQIQTVLEEINPFAAAYRHMYVVEREENARAVLQGHTPSNITMVFREGRDERRYNVPLHDEVAAVFVGEDGAPPGNHDIVAYPKDHPLQNISHMNPNCDPMMYPILFPSGQKGWDHTEQHTQDHRTAIHNRLTQLQYYSYRLAVRCGFSAIHQAGKLLHQYLVDAYVKTEGERLLYISLHQSQLRVERYQGLMDHIHNEASACGMNPGKVVILPSSFAGSPCAMQQNFQDATAIVTNKGKPDLFLTFTCNPRSLKTCSMDSSHQIVQI